MKNNIKYGGKGWSGEDQEPEMLPVTLWKFYVAAGGANERWDEREGCDNIYHPIISSLKLYR